jgi:hypothetical protein
MVGISHADYSLMLVNLVCWRRRPALLLLCILRMLLSELRTQSGDFSLHGAQLVLVFLFHARHARFEIAYILPDIHSLTEDFARAGTAAAVT